MEKRRKGLGVRKTAAKCSKRIVKSLVDYLASDSYMYAPFLIATDSGPPPAEGRVAHPSASLPSPPPLPSSLPPRQETTVVVVKDSFEFRSARRRHAREAGMKRRRPSK